MLVSKEKNMCCGCSSCASSCPVKAIEIRKDEEGFDYPYIDENKCIKCNKCKLVCPLISNKDRNSELLATFAVKNKKNDIRMNSRSGGVFTALSDFILEKNGVVYGAISEDNIVFHERGSNSQERDKMRGSKYVQSSMKNCFEKIKQDLDNNLFVLFSGTSCQVDGLYSFLRKDYNNLFTVDIVCHGVPSPLVYNDYIKWREKIIKSKCVSFNFRNKKDYGWREHIETLSFENGKRVDSKIYTNIFYSDYILRPSCYNCKYKKIVHPADITIADYWNIENILPKFDDNHGVSLVLINNKKGKELFESVETNLEFVSTNIEESMQTPLYKSQDLPANRQQFWDDYQNLEFSDLIKKYHFATYRDIFNGKLYVVKSYIKKILIK